MIVKLKNSCHPIIREQSVMQTKRELKKSLLSFPGDSIQEHIDHIGMPQAELAERLDRSMPKLN